jgi:glycosyltransferase involved in cell wall biosynthesis
MNSSVPSSSISVVVAAHNRRQFYLDAVESVVRQLPTAVGAELLVVKNFRDSADDARLQGIGVRVIDDNSRDVGGTLAIAVQESRGEFIAFLDDDDLFLPSKLARFVDVLGANPSIGYYHNEFVPMFTQNAGNDLSARMHTAQFRRRSAKKFVHVLPLGGGNESAYEFLAQRNREQNLSSTIIRREIAMRAITTLQGLQGMTDTSMLFVALLGGKPLAFDESIETIVRRHGENTSATTREVYNRLEVFDVLGKAVAGPQVDDGTRRYLRLRAARESAYGAVLGISVPKVKLFDSLCTTVASFRRWHQIRDALYAGICTTELLIPGILRVARHLIMNASAAQAPST